MSSMTTTRGNGTPQVNHLESIPFMHEAEPFSPPPDLERISDRFRNLQRLDKKACTTLALLICSNLPKLASLATSSPRSKEASIYCASFARPIAYTLDRWPYSRPVIIPKLAKQSPSFFEWIIACLRSLSKWKPVSEARHHRSRERALSLEECACGDELLEDVGAILLAMHGHVIREESAEVLILFTAENLLIMLYVWHWSLFHGSHDRAITFSAMVHDINKTMQKLGQNTPLVNQRHVVLDITNNMIQFARVLAKSPDPSSSYVLDQLLTIASGHLHKSLLDSGFFPSYVRVIHQLLSPKNQEPSKDFRDNMALVVELFLDRTSQYFSTAGLALMKEPNQLISVIWRASQISPSPVGGYKIRDRCTEIVKLLIGYSTSYSVLRHIRHDVKKYCSRKLRTSFTPLSDGWKMLHQAIMDLNPLRRSLFREKHNLCDNPNCTEKSTIPDMKCCVSCKLKMYCSRACQYSDWKRHCLECRSAAFLDLNETTFDVIFYRLQTNKVTESIKDKITPRVLALSPRNPDDTSVITVIRYKLGQIEPIIDIVTRPELRSKFPNYFKYIAKEEQDNGHRADVLFLTSFFRGEGKQDHVVIGSASLIRTV